MKHPVLYIVFWRIQKKYKYQNTEQREANVGKRLPHVGEIQWPANTQASAVIFVSLFALFFFFFFKQPW